MAWQPPARKEWVEHLNALGANLADGGRSFVSLDPDAMLADACEDFLRSAERQDYALARKHKRRIEKAWTLALRELLARDLLLN